MELKKQDILSSISIYRGAGRDFPRSELKPLFIIVYYYLTGRYRCYAVKGKNGVDAYAMLFMPKKGDAKLLDYFAVAPEMRGKNVGSEMLARLLKAEGNIVLEVENPAFAKSDEELEEMQRRIRFYERAGFVLCPYEVKLFGVEFRIMSSAATCSIDDINSIYNDMISKPLRKQFLEIRNVQRPHKEGN